MPYAHPISRHSQLIAGENRAGPPSTAIASAGTPIVTQGSRRSLWRPCHWRSTVRVTGTHFTVRWHTLHPAGSYPLFGPLPWSYYYWDCAARCCDFGGTGFENDLTFRAPSEWWRAMVGGNFDLCPYRIFEGIYLFIWVIICFAHYIYYIILLSISFHFKV